MDSDPNIRVIRSNVGERIKALRKKKGLTQARLGEMVDLDRTYIVGVEKGHRNISLDNLIKISLGLGTPLSKLFRNVDADVLEQLKHSDKAPPPNRGRVFLLRERRPRGGIPRATWRREMVGYPPTQVYEQRVRISLAPMWDEPLALGGSFICWLARRLVRYDVELIADLMLIINHILSNRRRFYGLMQQTTEAE